MTGFARQPGILIDSHQNAAGFDQDLRRLANGETQIFRRGIQTKSHNAVAAAVSQGRADWGVAINTIADPYGLGFIPLQAEHYDFVVPKARLERPAVRMFCELLKDPGTRQQLSSLGFDV